MKQAFALLAFFTVAMLSACSGAGESDATNSNSEATQKVVAEFAPPANGLLTLQTAKLYSDASLALLLLSQQWIDRLEKAPDTQEKILILGGFEKARDQVCRKIGLTGIKEYEWISSVALQNPQNREIAAKVGIQMSSK